MTNQSTSLQPGCPPRPIHNAFFLPRGLLGRLGGALMTRGLPQQEEIADLITTPGTGLCEVGCGPGVLADLLAKHPLLRQHLVDPSPIMRSQAAHRCRQWQHAGRVDVSAGTADRLPLPAASSDTVVAINTVVMWPDLAAALREIRRVLLPGARLVLSWHSPTALKYPAATRPGR